MKELLERLQRGQLTAKQVLEAFTLQAVAATEQTNCVTEFLYDSALLQVQQLDQSSEPKGIQSYLMFRHVYLFWR